MCTWCCSGLTAFTVCFIRVEDCVWETTSCLCFLFLPGQGLWELILILIIQRLFFMIVMIIMIMTLKGTSLDCNDNDIKRHKSRF